MNPSLISLLFLLVFMPLTVITFVFPPWNMNMALNSDAKLRAAMQTAFDQASLASSNSEQIENNLADTSVPGLKIQKISVQEQDQYWRLELQYSYQSLINSKFADSSNKTKTIILMGVKNL